MLVGILFIPQMIGWPQKESYCKCANRPKSCFLIKISAKVHYHALAKSVSKSVLYPGRHGDTKAVFIPGEQLPSDVLKALLHGREDLPHLGGSQVSVKDTK